MENNVCFICSHSCSIRIENNREKVIFCSKIKEGYNKDNFIHQTHLF